MNQLLIDMVYNLEFLFTIFSINTLRYSIYIIFARLIYYSLHKQTNLFQEAKFPLPPRLKKIRVRTRDKAWTYPDPGLISESLR